jgi:hypothetical protein
VTLVWLLVALNLGLAVGANVAYRTMLVRCDLHDYRKIALEAARVRQVYADADHEHRLRLRTEAATAELRLAVGDLLDTVQTRDRQIARLRRRNGPVPVYGNHRRQAAVR